MHISQIRAIELATIRWSNRLPGLNLLPDGIDVVHDILYTQTLAVQGDTTHPLNAALDTDLNLHTSLDGLSWDSIPYVERNWGDAQIKTILVQCGPPSLRFRLDNNTPNQIATVPGPHTTGTVEGLAASIIINPPGGIRLIQVELDGHVSGGSGTYRITSHRAGETEVGLVPLTTITNTARATFRHAVSVDSDVALIIRYYVRHTGDVAGHTITTQVYRTITQFRATFTARVLHVG
ncbi:MAG: hypothetical protein DDT30_02066 [Dehalococcoidia bacterium]|nr:hypothetical protein [Bacillota bacterium]